MTQYRRLSKTGAIIFGCLMLTGMATTANADAVAQLSSRESYVGMPITLYVQVSGQGAGQAPQIPEIDGLKIVESGAPSRSSQVSIINGRRTESSSVTYAYRVTPQRAGIFQIPSLEVNTGNGIERTRPIRFSAAKSETGDLMFAEVTGQQEKTFVGEPIDLTLKIWIKPFVDREREIKLSAQNMWQTISNEQTEWGGFLETLKTLQEDASAVRVSEVLKADSEGIERGYYLYEIDATIYPKAAGSLQAEDIQLVSQYPTALGKSRDPFESFFANSPFGNDDFFSRRGFSPFGSSLSVTSTRPIIVQPDVSSVEVSPIPTANQPVDYRGAVGQYALVTQASPTTVKAGDPISLTIGIRGTGPMELVQSPPLSELSSLTSDFKVSAEPLAGVVQDDVKVFQTTIRPRQEGITQIPAIPFSFFDPDQEQFVTVYSNPIDITVNKADKLALDSIVGARGMPAVQDETATAATPKISLANHDQASVLKTTAAGNGSGQWLWLLFAPPLFCIGFWLYQLRAANQGRTGYRDTVRRINGASNAGTIAEAVRQFAHEKFGNQDHEFQPILASLYDDCNHAAFAGEAPESLEPLKTRARTFTRSMFRARTNGQANRQRTANGQPVRTWAAITGCIALILLAGLAAGLDNGGNSSAPDRIGENHLNLTAEQQQSLLQEATTAYQKGQALAGNDAADAKQSFSKAVDKYQSLVDSGIHNSKLYFNLGNACLQTDEVGRAMANFHRAAELNPLDLQASRNLLVARKMLQQDDQEMESTATAWGSQVSHWSANMVRVYSLPLLFVTWLCFWGLLWIPMVKPSWHFQKTALAVGIAIAVLCGGMVAAHHDADASPLAVVVVDDVAMHAGNGESFAELPTADLSQGTAVRVLQQRGNWLQVRSPDGTEGWIRLDDLEIV
ncbi:MAG: BatD family protein [Mariniblastus sp.]|nr:BatD family protein [Mariniblastus sp.]